MNIANAFSGGIFLGIALLHMLPETIETYNKLTEEKEEHDEHEEHEEEEEHDHDHGFNLAYFLVFIGYAAILLLEKVLFKFREHDHDHGYEHKQVSGIVNDHELNEIGRNSNENEGGNEDSKEIVGDENAVDISKMGEEPNNVKVEINQVRTRQAKNIDSDSNLEGKYEDKKAKTYFSVLTPLALMIALSVHSAFAGIAVGLEKDLADLWAFILAIVLHKGGEAVSLGISLARSYKLSQQWLMYSIILIFSLSTPLGVFIGILVPDDSDWTEVVLNSLSIGAFLYIGASHIVAEEFEKTDWRWTKMILFMFGAMIIMSITYIKFD